MADGWKIIQGRFLLWKVSCLLFIYLCGCVYVFKDWRKKGGIFNCGGWIYYMSKPFIYPLTDFILCVEDIRGRYTWMFSCGKERLFIILMTDFWSSIIPTSARRTNDRCYSSSAYLVAQSAPYWVTRTQKLNHKQQPLPIYLNLSIIFPVLLWYSASFPVRTIVYR